MSQLGRVGARAAAQAVRESTGGSTARHMKDRAQQSSSMARTSQVRATSGSLGRKAAAQEAKEEMRRRAAEESLRTVMFLSFWGPNT